ncbi:hypothetical protein CMUS01_07691 [Colletotrichum musicola]|uniref:Uncharacterized protein n=1 Tax=Colletotrichum musicola TaxID=2175873 RepID=A0A8H6KFH6_9PEZI|nr:hypothetical protein CMUS01_07691 [Colletotrichum musicola]
MSSRATVLLSIFSLREPIQPYIQSTAQMTVWIRNSEKYAYRPHGFWVMASLEAKMSWPRTPPAKVRPIVMTASG